MEVIAIIIVIALFISYKGKYRKTELESIQQDLKEDSLTMWWWRIRTGKENRNKYKHTNLHTGKRNY